MVWAKSFVHSRASISPIMPFLPSFSIPFPHAKARLSRMINSIFPTSEFSGYFIFSMLILELVLVHIRLLTLRNTQSSKAEITWSVFQILGIGTLVQDSSFWRIWNHWVLIWRSEFCNTVIFNFPPCPKKLSLFGINLSWTDIPELGRVEKLNLWSVPQTFGTWSSSDNNFLN